MAIVIKEIRVHTVVEKKIIAEYELSTEAYHKIEQYIFEKLSEQPTNKKTDIRRKKER